MRLKELVLNVMQESQHMDWQGRLDALFSGLKENNQTRRVEAPNQEAATMRRPDAPIQVLQCPLHDHVRLEQQIAIEGMEFVECSEPNCPISLPWDKNLAYVILKVRGKMDPNRTFFCECDEVSKVGFIENVDDSRDRGRCYLSCTQAVKCNFFEWID